MEEVEFDLDSNDILSPEMLLENKSIHGAECRALYIQTFEESTKKVGKWKSLPQEDWNHIATIFSDKIEIYPVYLAPHTLRYLTPKHGRISRVIYPRHDQIKLPDNVDKAYTDILINTPRGICDDLLWGGGLSKELIPVWRELLHVKNIDTIEIVKRGEIRAQGNKVILSEVLLNEIRLDFNRADKNRRYQLRSAKKWHVRNEVLNEIDPEAFPRLVFSDNNKLVELKFEKSRRKKSEVIHIKEKIQEVKQNLDRMASSAPKELFELHADIERVTLSGMIEKFEVMLQQNLPEPRWQRFFEDNTFVLTMLFSLPVHLLHKQFNARSPNITGDGAQIGDFLFGEKNRSLAIIEIKKPSTELLQNGRPYRNNVYAPNYEISGAITQVLTQKSSLQNQWVHLVYNNKTLNGYQSNVVKCIVLAGITPEDEEKRTSFNLFRNSCKDVDVITYDELLEKLKILLSHLNRDENEEIAF